MATDFWLDQLTVAKAQAAALNTAILFLYANPHLSYNLDTGQSSQSVRRPDPVELQKSYDSLLNTIASLEARCNGASQQARPGW